MVKNQAFIYDEYKQGYVLSKAYDLTKANELLEHQMAINGESNPNIDDLMSIQRDMNLDRQRCIQIINHTKQVLGIK